MLVFKAFSPETDLKVTLCCAKKTQNGKGNLKLTKITLDRNKIYCAEDNHNYISTCVQKNSQIQTLIK